MHAERGKINPMKKLANKHKRLITMLQQKIGLSDYQILWLSFANGIILGIVIIVSIL